MSEHKPDTTTPGGNPPPPPEPNFRQIVDTFAVPALVWTGHLKNPADEGAEPNLDLAKFQIGLLEVLENKTQGNLEKPEQEYLAAMLHNVRLAFVRATDEAREKSTAGPDAKSEPEQEKKD